MKRKMLAALLALAALLPGCAGRTASADVLPTPKAEMSAQDVTEGAELYCLADSQEEAGEIADLYGIELVDFDLGVATFHTEEDPGAVIRRGKENGWRSLSLNGTNHLN